MSLRTEIGLGPGDIVLDGDPALPEGKSTEAPTFRPLSIVVKRSPSQQQLSSCLSSRVPKEKLWWISARGSYGPDALLITQLTVSYMHSSLQTQN